MLEPQPVDLLDLRPADVAADGEVLVAAFEGEHDRLGERSRRVDGDDDHCLATDGPVVVDLGEQRVVADRDPGRRVLDPLLVLEPTGLVTRGAGLTDPAEGDGAGVFGPVANTVCCCGSLAAR